VEVAASRPLGLREETYNLTVDEFSDYLAEGVLVHNMKCTNCGGQGGGGGGCFTAGTPVLTPAGPRPIESIRPGDVVYSVDEASRKLVAQKVKDGPFPHSGENVYELALADGTRLHVTSHHLFFDPKSGQYKPVKELSIGESVLAFDAPSAGERLALPALGRSAARADLFSPAEAPLPADAVSGPARLVQVVGLRLLPIGQARVYDLLMDGPHHNYLAGGVLVHNGGGGAAGHSF
jgi:hypothetical protein